MLPPLKPIAMKERVSMLFIERGQIDVLDGTFVMCFPHARMGLNR